MAKKVTTIPPTLSKIAAQPMAGQKAKRKVAGYARVSTDLEEQASSYEAQMDYYRKYISGRRDWEFVGMYSDEGISATSTKRREGFNTMVEDALAGKIDLIITKSVSRFARNTVDSLSTIRKLKEKGTEVYFEKENIWTFDAKGELLITIMSSLAQEESRSISENTTWGRRKSFADGKVVVAYKTFLGYGKDFEIIEEEAQTVRLIYKLFLEGVTCYAITKRLEALGLKSAGGGTRWHQSTIKSILQNEKYKGDGLLQKSYTVDFLTKKRVPNNGEVQQYYVEGHHEGIVDPETFEMAQMEMRRRKKNNMRYQSISIFSAKLLCGECGCFYGPRIWHSNDKFRKEVWQCNKKYQNARICSTPAVTEAEIKAFFLKAINKLVGDKEGVLEELELLRQMTCDTESLKAEEAAVVAEMESIYKDSEKMISRNAMAAQDQAGYNEKYGSLISRYEELQARRNELAEQVSTAKASGELIRNLIRTIKAMDGVVTAFQENLWNSTVESMTILSKGKALVRFKGGFEVDVDGC